jgi:hypothetical protein
LVPSKAALAQRRHYQKHRERYRAESKVVTEEDKLKVLKKNLMSKYGLTLQQFTAMRVMQGDVCAICKDPLSPAYVDHCHTTGRVRGLLCNHCNKGLGFFRDHPSLLTAAADYLKGTP